MIKNKEDFVLNNLTFKPVKHILYEDLIVSDFNSFNVNDFNSNVTEDIYLIETSFRNYYFKENETIVIKDCLTNEYNSTKLHSICNLDKLIINKKLHSFEKESIEFKDKLYLKHYDYSVSFADIISKYNLPKHFLLKALTTGCPDEEYPQAKEWNISLQKSLDKNLTTIEELKTHIVEEFSKKPSKQYLNINYNLLDLFYLCVIGDYELLTHTSLKLKIKDKKIFESVIKLLINLNIKKTVYNDVFNSEQYSVILINSSLIYSLFKSKFNNFNFILNLTSLFSHHLFKRLTEYSVYLLHNEESLMYLQEFLFRHKVIYKKEIMNNYIYLVKNINFKIVNHKIELPILSINKIDNKNIIEVL